MCQRQWTAGAGHMGSHAAKRNSQVCGRERERAARAQGSAESSGKRTQGTGDPGQKAIPVGSVTSPHFQPDWYESAVLRSTVTFRLWPAQWIPRREWRGVRAP